ncbi:MAG: Panacea domain-containing protein [Pelolinea sp.]|nr:Panacea domain-containing protein [Pelolinea sp.]
MTIHTSKEYDKKMKELILYVSQKCEGDSSFGATKLNKLLFFSDFMAYLNFGKSITGQEYQCLEKGPAPKRLVPIREELMKSQEAVLRPNSYYGFPQERLIPLREPDLSEFSGEEIALVDFEIDHWREKSAKEISAESHKFIGWICAEELEVIPYETAFVGTRELTEEEFEFARNIPIEKLPKPVNEIITG